LQIAVNAVNINVAEDLIDRLRQRTVFKRISNRRWRSKI